MATDIVTLSDPQSGAQAKIAPGVGFNCYSFSVPAAAGPLETLWSDPAFATGTTKSSRSGIPLMFPFAGRIGGATYRYHDRTYQLTAGDGLGNAIHGFVIDRPWRVVHQAADRVVGEFQASVDLPSVLQLWPSDFRIRADYQLAGRTLASEFTITNPDSKPLPFGFGTHPYFRLPLGGPSAEDCVARVAVSTNWQLEKLLPTGKTTKEPVLDQLSRGMKLADMKLDHVFGGLTFDNHRTTATVTDPAGKHTVAITFDDQFTACVVFNPPHRQAVCIEPYTTIPDAFSLAERGIDPHLLTLPPGGTFRTRIEIRVD